MKKKRIQKIEKEPSFKEFQKILKKDEENINQYSVVISEILSFLDILDMTRISMTNKEFHSAVGPAILLRKSFSQNEYQRMLDLKKGASEELCFKLANSTGINFQKSVESITRNYDIFTYSCYKGYTKVVTCLLYHIKHPASVSVAVSCSRNNSEIVRILLEDGRIDPSWDKNLALRICCMEGYETCLKLLLGHKNVNPNCGPKFLKKMNVEKLKDKRISRRPKENLGELNLFYQEPLRLAITNKQKDIINILMNDERVDLTGYVNDAVDVLYEDDEFEF